MISNSLDRPGLLFLAFQIRGKGHSRAASLHQNLCSEPLPRFKDVKAPIPSRRATLIKGATLFPSCSQESSVCRRNQDATQKGGSPEWHARVFPDPPACISDSWRHLGVGTRTTQVYRRGSGLSVREGGGPLRTRGEGTVGIRCFQFGGGEGRTGFGDGKDPRREGRTKQWPALPRRHFRHFI